jgi:hypothetical protein
MQRAHVTAFLMKALLIRGLNNSCRGVVQHWMIILLTDGKGNANI